MVVTGTAAIRARERAARGALAARELLVPRVTCATVVGRVTDVAVLVAALVEHVVGLASVTVHPGGGGDLLPGPGRIDEDSGVLLSSCADARRALFGADLVVLAAAPDTCPVRGLVPGAVVVNVSGTPSPDCLVQAADRLFVDGPVRTHAYPRSPVSLSAVLRGERAGRTGDGELLLVDVLGWSEREPPYPDPSFAGTHEGAAGRSAGCPGGECPGRRGVCRPAA